MRSLTGAVEIFYEKLEPKNIFRQVGRTPKCDSKTSPTELKNTKIENVFGSHFGVQLTCKKMFLGSRFQWKIFIASVRDHTRSRYETNEFGIFRGL